MLGDSELSYMGKKARWQYNIIRKRRKIVNANKNNTNESGTSTSHNIMKMETIGMRVLTGSLLKEQWKQKSK